MRVLSDGPLSAKENAFCAWLFFHDQIDMSDDPNLIWC